MQKTRKGTNIMKISETESLKIHLVTEDNSMASKTEIITLVTGESNKNYTQFTIPKWLK